MKNINVVEPVFVSAFRCTGSECRDHCCKGWDVDLDKASVNRYLKSSRIEIKTLATDNIITTKNSYAKWGKIKLSGGTSCAFLDEKRLCKIHKDLGAAALSPTCATYPRINLQFKQEEQKSVTISCPEAARLLLTQPDAMLLQQSTQIRKHEIKALDYPLENKLLNLMCANIANVCEVHMDEAFYAMANLFLYKEKLAGAPDSASKAEDYFFQLIGDLEQGNIAAQLSQIAPDYSLQWALLMRLQVYLSAKAGMRSWETLNHYVAKLIHILTEGAKNNNTELSMQRLDTVWNAKVMPWLSERPHLMSNYIQYRIYHDRFPSENSTNLLPQLYLLVAEWFLLKSVIAACVELVGEVVEEDIINIIYSYHAVTKHDAKSTVAFVEQIEKTKVNDDLSLIYLLR